MSFFDDFEDFEKWDYLMDDDDCQPHWPASVPPPTHYAKRTCAKKTGKDYAKKAPAKSATSTFFNRLKRALTGWLTRGKVK